MPIGVFKSVREVSSEDANHVAANLIKDIAGKKWKTQSVGEKMAHVILEFEEPQQIVGVDIGNEHSAFIEVMVSKSSCDPEDFKILLLSTSFMTPTDSKCSQNVNRVRCFNSNALNSNVLEDKWKLVKIICLQPFNKHVQYGLSFIKVHVSAPAVAKSVSLLDQALKAEIARNQREESPAVALKAEVPFKLREESPESDGTDGSKLFQRWKATRSSGGMPEVSTAAAIRDASLSAASNQLNDSTKAAGSAIGIRESSKTVFPASTSDSSPLATTSRLITSSTPLDGPPILDRNRDELVYGNDDLDDGAAGSSNKIQRLQKHLEEDKKRLDEKTSQMAAPSKSVFKRMRTSLHTYPGKMYLIASAQGTEKNEETKPNNENTKSMGEEPSCSSRQKRKSNVEIESSTKRSKQELEKIRKTKKYVPFNKLLSGVTLVISGIQNPDRTDLRKMAKAMGACYKPTWGSACTHLICAFPNSPKFKQVRAKGRGKIVSRYWVEHCYEHRRYLPWRRYALDPLQMIEAESDEELIDETLKPEPKPEPQPEPKPEPKPEPVYNEPAIVNDISKEPEPQEMVDYTSDTEEDPQVRIRKLMHRALAEMRQPDDDENSANNLNGNQPRDVFDEDTEEEDYLSKVKRDN